MLVRWETSRSTVKPSSGDIWVMTVRTPMAWSTTAWGGEGLLQLPVFSAQPLHLRAQPGGPRWRVSHRGGWGKPCAHPGKQRVAVIFIACPNIVFGTHFAAPDTAERAPGPQPGGRTRGAWFRTSRSRAGNPSRDAHAQGERGAGPEQAGRRRVRARTRLAHPPGADVHGAMPYPTTSGCVGHAAGGSGREAGRAGGVRRARTRFGLSPHRTRTPAASCAMTGSVAGPASFTVAPAPCPACAQPGNALDGGRRHLHANPR